MHLGASLNSSSADPSDLRETPMDELNYQIRRVAPSEGLYGVAWQTYSTSHKGVPVWESACFDSLELSLKSCALTRRRWSSKTSTSPTRPSMP